MTSELLALAIGHVRNAGWQLMGNGRPEGLGLGLRCLDLEALLNPDDLEPAVIPAGPDPVESLAAARRILEDTPELVAPAAWPVLESLIAELG